MSNMKREERREKREERREKREERREKRAERREQSRGVFSISLGLNSFWVVQHWSGGWSG